MARGNNCSPLARQMAPLPLFSGGGEIAVFFKKSPLFFLRDIPFYHSKADRDFPLLLPFLVTFSFFWKIPQKKYRKHSLSGISEMVN